MSELATPSVTINVFDAVRDGNAEKLRAAIEQDPTCVHLDRVDVLPLMVAVREGHLECAEILLLAGANVNAANEYGWTALLEAVRQGNYEMVGLLLDYGANWEVMSKRGDGIYHVATEIPDASMIAQLYDWTEKSSVDQATRQGRMSPLMLAAERRLPDHVRILLELGADPQRKNRAGATAWDLAEGWPEGQALLAQGRTITPAAPAAAPASATAEAPAAADPEPIAPPPAAGIQVTGVSTIQKRRPGPR